MFFWGELYESKVEGQRVSYAVQIVNPLQANSDYINKIELT